MNIEKYEDTFNIEANILNYAKCTLLRNEELEDFALGSIDVIVYKNSDGYDLYFLNYHMKLICIDNLIYDYSLQIN